MMNEDDIKKIYVNTVKSIISGNCDDAYNRGYVAALQSVLELPDEAWKEMIKNVKEQSD